MVTMKKENIIEAEEKIELRKKLIQKKANHYISIFEQSNEEKRDDWNWCAFLIAPIWFAYRKMYDWAALAWLIQELISMLAGMADGGTGVCIIRFCCILFFNCIMAAKANTLYENRIDFLCETLQESGIEKEKIIKRKGGVSTAAAFVVIAIDILIIVFRCIEGIQ